MLINFVFPAYAAPVKGQYVDIRAHAENFNREKGTFRAQASMQNSAHHQPRKMSESLSMCGEVTDIQPHADPDFRVVTVSA